MSGAGAGAEPLSQRLYRTLADREFHSGTRLAAECGVTRSAVWKSLGALAAQGLVVDAVPNRGYRLPQAGAPLDAGEIIKALSAVTAAQLHRGEVCWSTDSTNAQLLRRVDVPAGRFDFMLAEYQSAGRGRRARTWFAPPGGALCLSIGWAFSALPRNAGALSLAVGVCVLRALRAWGGADIALKWPNDLVAPAGKLGGILIELRAESAGPAYVVIGIGLNVALGSMVMEQVHASGTRAVDLDALGIPVSNRNPLAAAIIDQVVAGLGAFERQGLAPFVSEWGRADALVGRAVVVNNGDQRINGHARGIDADGALCVQTHNGLQRFVSGEVSVRAEH